MFPVNASGAGVGVLSVSSSAGVGRVESGGATAVQVEGPSLPMASFPFPPLCEGSSGWVGLLQTLVAEAFSTKC